MKWLIESSRALARAMAELSPSCRQAARLQSEAMDHKLKPVQRLGLCLHIALCKWCRRYGQHLNVLREASREQPEVLDAPPQTLSLEARERIRRRLEEAQGSR